MALSVYYFGVYHWRRRGRRLLVGLLGAIAAAVAWTGSDRLSGTGRLAGRAVALFLAVFGGRRALAVARTVGSPPPWSLDRRPYGALAAALPLGDADRWLDVGCGTGRSLVGLAPTAGDAAVTAVDVFDARVILGNGPALAARNAGRAGLDARPVRGDAARLPVSDGSQDVVTLCRVLHDLPADDAAAALAEARRVLDADGRLGVIELPLPHEEDADPDAYWRDRLADAGFRVTEADRAGQYYTYVAAPA